MTTKNVGPQDFVLADTLNLYQKKALNKKLAQNKVYFAKLMASTQSGVARLELYDNQKQSLTLVPTEMVVGNDVVKVDRVTLPDKDKRNAFVISTKEQHYTFYVADTHLCENWVKNIRETLLGEVHGTGSPHDKKVVSQVNEIYEPADKFFPQSKEFLVTIAESTRARMGVDGKVRLVVENDSIAIVTPSGKMIVRWALKNLRKFSYQDKMFIVEAGRKSTLGEGNFSFQTDEGEKISSAIDMRKRELKQRHKTAPESSLAPIHPPTSTPPKPPHVEFQSSFLNDDSLYDTFENVLIPPNSTHNWGHSDNKVIPVENKPESLARPISPYSQSQNSKPPNASQYTSPSVKQQPTRSYSRDEPPKQNQAGIYCEPELITDAWKTHGYGDSEDTAAYASLSRTRQEAEEDHYWRGNYGVPSVDVQKEEENLYAVVDMSKKKSNKK